MVKKRKTKDPNSTVKKISSRELKDVEELVLPFSKLKFCSEQLQNLNYIFTRNLSQEPDLEYTKAILLAKSVTERLIQRLLCGVGLLDPRFSTKFLVALHDTQNCTRFLSILRSTVSPYRFASQISQIKDLIASICQKNPKLTPFPYVPDLNALLNPRILGLHMTFLAPECFGVKLTISWQFVSRIY